VIPSRGRGPARGPAQAFVALDLLDEGSLPRWPAARHHRGTVAIYGEGLGRTEARTASDALEHDERHGVWGGLSTRERTALSRLRRAS